MINAQNNQLPPPKSTTTRIGLLYNHLIDILRKQSLGWKGGLHLTVGKSFVDRLSNLLWYIDPYQENISQRSFTMPAFIEDLPEYKANHIYNEYYNTSKKKKTPISTKTLRQYLSSLQLSIVQPWALESQWNDFHDQLITLCTLY